MKKVVTITGKKVKGNIKAKVKTNRINGYLPIKLRRFWNKITKYLKNAIQSTKHKQTKS